MIVEVSKEEIENIFKQIFNQELKLNIYSKIVVYKEKEIMGFLIYDDIFDRYEIEYIGVLEQYRNKGIGSKLMEYLKDKSISLEVDINNKYAIKLYEKYGFKKASIRKNYYNGNDAYLMIKEV